MVIVIRKVFFYRKHTIFSDTVEDISGVGKERYSSTAVDFECVTACNIPHSSNLISSSFSDIISNISIGVLTFCLRDIS